MEVISTIRSIYYFRGLHLRGFIITEDNVIIVIQVSNIDCKCHEYMFTEIFFNFLFNLQDIIENLIMKISQCCHIRIRDDNEYGINVERFIKSIEKQYKIDFKSIPQWKQLIQQLHASTTDYKKIIQSSKYRKLFIIDKLYTENTRPSPFELTDELARTAKTWEALKLKCIKSKISGKEDPEVIITHAVEYDEIPGELSDINLTKHPNTEMVPSENNIELKSEFETEAIIIEPSHLPSNICTNQHKLISPLRSEDSSLRYRSVINEIEKTSEDKPKEWLFLEPTSAVRSKEITVPNLTLKEQSIIFSILNCTTKYMHIQFKNVTERAPFKKIRILPLTPLKLYPGISVSFKFIFKLSQTRVFPPSSLYFRVGYNVLFEGPIEALLIPIVFKAMTSQTSVPKTVSIAPAYSWHVNKKIGFPTELVKISNSDNCIYHVHIIKRLYNFAKEPDVSVASVDVIAPDTASILQRADDVETPKAMLSSSKDDILPTENGVKSLETIDTIVLLVDEIVELALEAFVFEHTCLDLRPHTKRYIPVYFTKAEYTGFHQRYYDFEFCDPDTEELILTKTTRVYAEILPHPVQIHPDILDMSTSPITHGFCEDNFIVTNTHNWIPVNVKVKLTTKMKQLFHISPIEVMIPANSKMNFQVRLCSRNFASANETDDFAHFTFKIIFSGHQSVYKNIPPWFYEVIAPCAMEFKRIYNENYYLEMPEISRLELGTTV